MAGALGAVGAPPSEPDLNREHYIPSTERVASRGMRSAVARHRLESSTGCQPHLILDVAAVAAGPERGRGGPFGGTGHRCRRAETAMLPPPTPDRGAREATLSVLGT